MSAVLVTSGICLGLDISASGVPDDCLFCHSAQVNLSDNQIGSVGAAALAKALETNRALLHVCCVSHLSPSIKRTPGKVTPEGT